MVCEMSYNLPENPTLPGPRHATYGDMCNAYLVYINMYYGSYVIVVLGVYEPSTEDAVYLQWTIGKWKSKIEIPKSNVVSPAQD